MIDTKELRRLAQAATPGPWWVNQDGLNHGFERGVLEINAKDWHALAGAWAISGAKPSEEGAANAAFIAAANPAAISELLDRLDAAEKSDAESIAMYRRVRDERDDWITKAEAAHRDYNALEGYYTELAEKLEAAEKAITEAYQRGYATGREEIATELEFAKQEIANLHDDISEWMDKCDTLRAKIEQMERQEPVAWRTFDGEGGYDYRSYEDNENYKLGWDARNPNHIGWVEPLYALPGAQAQNASSIPDGWKLVPIVSTDEMDNAGSDHCDGYLSTAQAVWDAMLAAAPEDKP